MSDTLPKSLFYNEFLTWAEAQERGRFELFDGNIVAMAPETADHARAKLSAANALKTAIANAGLPCEAFVDGLTVVVKDDTVYEPDALVNCGPPVPGGQLTATNPVVVLEVLSPSTSGIDKSTKLNDYFSVDTIQHYLIVDLGRRVLFHYRRSDDGNAGVSMLRDGTVLLDPPGLTLAVADLFG